MYKTNNKYKILTSSGFQNFEGINVIKETKYIKVFLENGLELSCSLDHKILTKDGFKKACDLQKSDLVDTINGFIEFKKSEVINADILLFDPHNVNFTNSYYSNNINSHNCKEFLGTGETVIDGETLTLLSDNTNREYWTRYNNRLRLWKEAEPVFDYVIGVDCSLGRDRDYSAFQVINCYNGEQVAEFYSNKTPIDEFTKLISEVGKEYNNALVLPERNTIGNNLVEYLVKREEYENVWMDKTGKFGYQTTQQSKIQIIANLEDAIRTKKVKINSERTVKELLTFVIDVETGKYKADDGQHDDLVMSLALAVFALNEMIENSPTTITKLGQTNLYEPMDIISARSTPRPIYGGKSYDEIKWVFDK